MTKTFKDIAKLRESQRDSQKETGKQIEKFHNFVKEANENRSRSHGLQWQ